MTEQSRASTPIERLHGFFSSQPDFARDDARDGTYDATLERRDGGRLVASATIRVYHDDGHWVVTISSLSYLRVHSVAKDVTSYGGFMVNVGNLMNAAMTVVA